jgi:hypothetical protein
MYLAGVHLQPYFASLGLQIALVAGKRIAARRLLRYSVVSIAQPIRLRIQNRRLMNNGKLTKFSRSRSRALEAQPS